MAFLFSDIDRDESAKGFRVSNPSIHQCAALAASLQVWLAIEGNISHIHHLLSKVFAKVGIEQIRLKSVVLTQYLQHLLESQLRGQSTLSFSTYHRRRWLMNRSVRLHSADTVAEWRTWCATVVPSSSLHCSTNSWPIRESRRCGKTKILALIEPSNFHRFRLIFAMTSFVSLLYHCTIVSMISFDSWHCWEKLSLN